MWEIISAHMPSLDPLLPRLKCSAGFTDNLVSHCHSEYDRPISDLVIFSTASKQTPIAFFPVCFYIPSFGERSSDQAGLSPPNMECCMQGSSQVKSSPGQQVLLMFTLHTHVLPLAWALIFDSVTISYSISLFFGRATWLVGSQFPDQG